MRDTNNVFHLAIPTHDLDEAFDFYVTKLGCKLARRYHDRITLDFFGDQIVCHLSQQTDETPRVYPRHFGVTFRDRAEYDQLLHLVKQREVTLLHEPASRFEGLVEEHLMFFVVDPSNNVLEFKYYHDPRMMY